MGRSRAASSPDKWKTAYYRLTPEGRKIATLPQLLLRSATPLGYMRKWRLSDGAIAALAHLRSHKTQPRSLEQIWAWTGSARGYPLHSKTQLLNGITELQHKELIRRA